MSTILLYSPAIPDLLLALPFYFFWHYWLDKWQILRICKLPPQLSKAFINRALNIVGVAVLIHIIAAMWFFSVPEIFPVRIMVYEAKSRVKYYFMDNLSIVERFANPNIGVQYILFFSAIGALFVVEPIALEVANACCFRKPRRGQQIVGGTLNSYTFESIQKSNPADRFSYDMMKSKKYRRALLLLNQ